MNSKSTLHISKVSGVAWDARRVVVQMIRCVYGEAFVVFT